MTAHAFKICILAAGAIILFYCIKTKHKTKWGGLWRTHKWLGVGFFDRMFVYCWRFYCRSFSKFYSEEIH